MEAIHHVAVGVGSTGGGLAGVSWGTARLTGRVTHKFRKAEADGNTAHYPTSGVRSALVRLTVIALGNALLEGVASGASGTQTDGVAVVQLTESSFTTRVSITGIDRHLAAP